MQLSWRHSGAREVYKIALRILEKRQRSNEELRAMLKERHCEEAAFDEVLERLEELGYVNDHELAHLFIRKAQTKGWGPRRIRIELKKKGLAKFGEHLEDEVIDDYPRILEYTTQQRDKGKTDQQIMGALDRLGHRRTLIMRALKEAPKSVWETEMTIPPGLLDLDDEDFDDEDEP